MKNFKEILNEAVHEPGKNIYKDLKLGDTVKGVDESDGLILNKKVLMKTRGGYTLEGVKAITGDKFDVFLTKEEIIYIFNNLNKLK